MNSQCPRPGIRWLYYGSLGGPTLNSVDAEVVKPLPSFIFPIRELNKHLPCLWPISTAWQLPAAEFQQIGSLHISGETWFTICMWTILLLAVKQLWSLHLLYIFFNQYNKPPKATRYCLFLVPVNSGMDFKYCINLHYIPWWTYVLKEAANASS